MGNHRFRLSDMMPNAWFYKLKDMNRATPNRSSPQIHTSAKKTHQQHHPHNNERMRPPPTFTPSRASYYFPSDSPLHPKAFDTHFPPDPPRKSARKAHKKPISPRPIDNPDVVLDVGAGLGLPPIITRKPPESKQHGMQRLRMRATSPRVKVRVAQRGGGGGGGRQRKSLSESFAVVKNSSDPRKDFRESMMEMIEENGLRAGRDLEELLACYLSLNSDEYHGVIVKVFEEIWLDIN